MALTESERKRLFGIAKEKGLDNDMLHSVVYECTRKKSITKLATKDLPKIFNRINGNAKTAADKNKASDPQKKLMRDLTNELGHDEAWLVNFVKRNTKVDVIDWLNKVQASNIITGLKMIKERREGVTNEL